MYGSSIRPQEVPSELYIIKYRSAHLFPQFMSTVYLSIYNYGAIFWLKLWNLEMFAQTHKVRLYMATRKFILHENDERSSEIQYVEIL